MRKLLLLAVLFGCIQAVGQNNSTDIRRFGYLVNSRKYDQYVRVFTTEFMQRTFPNHSPLQLEGDIERLRTDANVFDKFAYEILVSYSGNKEMAGQVLYRLCGDANLSLRLVAYISSKYRKKLTSDIGGRKQIINPQKEEIQKKEKELEAAKYEKQVNQYYKKIDQNDSLQSSVKECIIGGHSDHGRPGGDPNSKNYTGGGYGHSGVSIARGLEGLRLTSLPSFEDDFNENAKVAVDIRVDETGKVVSAIYQSRGSTTASESMKSFAIRKALQIKFNTAGEESIGTLIFHFKLRN